MEVNSLISSFFTYLNSTNPNILFFILGLILIVLIFKFPIIYIFYRIIAVLIIIMFVLYNIAFYIFSNGFIIPSELCWFLTSIAIFTGSIAIFAWVARSDGPILNCFHDYTGQWFDLIKWLTLIGIISFAVEKTQDPSLKLILFISYMLVCSYIGAWILYGFHKFDNFYLKYLEDRRTPEELKEKEILDWKYGYMEGDSFVTALAFVLSIIIIFYLYTFINHIVILLMDQSSKIPH